jgi:hypothetical protein
MVFRLDGTAKTLVFRRFVHLSRDFPPRSLISATLAQSALPVFQGEQRADRKVPKGSEEFHVFSRDEKTSRNYLKADIQ